MRNNSTEESVLVFTQLVLSQHDYAVQCYTIYKQLSEGNTRLKQLREVKLALK